MNEHIQGLAKLLAHLGRPPSPQLSEVGRRWEAERYLMRTDPMLAALLRIEAIADDRAENHQCCASKIVAIRDLVRRVLSEIDGKPFRNPLFPLRT